MFEAPEIVYRDNARGAWAEVRGWHGTFVENVVQAIARDLLAAALQRLEVAGYPIVLHVHDEIVAEVAENFGSAEEFARIMSEPPSWATGLPLVAKGWSCACYGAKSAPKAQQSPIPPSPPIPSPSPPIPSPSPSPSPAKLNTPRPAPIDEPLTDGKILCPFHDDERPSLHVYDDEDDPHFHCFACGAHGPLSDLPEGSWTPAAPGARARADDEATLAYAHRLWEQARPIAGTLAARYLAEVRGIDVDALPPDIDTALRFHAACPFNRTERRPCLLALFRDVETDEPAGIHRIALTPEAQKIGRRMLGRWPAPRAIKLWPATDRLFLGEGVETVLAAATRLLYRGAPMHPAWAAGSGGNIGKFPVIDADLTLLVDHDEQGEGCANQCRRRWRLAGRDVVRLRPDRPGTDFNDLVLERCKP
jgi:hypothetical protein